jgi:hypothetical protein
VTGGDSGERKLTKIGSGKQVVGWRLSECSGKFVGVCMEANSVMGDETVDFFFYC